ncbi:MAG: DUF4430 domain-containing protein [Gaiellaceae bacterium MAG52_C11]|nr:DUF4430 domain-containing protein [Candidatus Gaiellasilicea maunaloa]
MRRPLALLSLLLLAAVLASGALAASVKIRVEGRTQTIYGAAQPAIRAGNALEALDAASTAGEFHYALTTASFGDYVSQIGKYAAAGSAGWVFKVNGVSPPVGADKVVLADGDVVLWYYATFGPTGGPPTLDLQRLPANCYLVQSVDDAGKRTRAGGATLTVDGKRFRTRQGRACIGRHAGLVRAIASGAIRSNAVR